MENSELFARNSSGFVRGFSALDVFIFNVLGYATGLSLATNPTILGGLYPNADIFWVLGFGFFLSLCTGFVYGAFAAKFPREGGDYVYIGRTLSPDLGFVANWGFTWSQVYGAGVFSGWAIRDSLSPAFLTFGYTAQSKWLVDVGSFLAHKYSIFFGGLVVLLVCTAIALLGQRALRKVLRILFLFAVLSSLLMIWPFCPEWISFPFCTASHTKFVARFNDFMQQATGASDAYNLILLRAEKEGLHLNQASSWWEALKALPVGYLIFFGFTYSAYVGGEVQRPERSQIIGILSALSFALVFSLIGMGSYYEVVGRDFNNAVAITKGLSDSILPAGGSMVFFSGVLIENPVVSFLMNFGSFLWFFLLPLVMIVLCVRNIFAWAMDRIVPERLTDVSAGNRPVIGTTVVTVCAAICLAADSLLGFPYVNYIALFSVCFFFTGIAAAFFPSRRPELFSSGPPLVNKLWLGKIPRITVAGVLTALMFAFILWSALSNDAYSGVKAGYIPWLVLAVVYLSGWLVWGYARPDRKRLFERIPPE